MSFTAKTKLVNTEVDQGQTKLRFIANYQDDQGNRVNDDWAQNTPAFTLEMWVTNEFWEQHQKDIGQNYLLTFEAE